ncbi:Neuropeptide-like protein 2 [Meloidogyne graminicola]|uniref:Neuropeptide-like protein 2 n=1 Tax=Meloidogyne graminicola TaxID=189291 RepID=A0A8S9ZB97_9BILA|nr:Neuropeptide-like protein 2 [Meloidogyne graminicola]
MGEYSGRLALIRKWVKRLSQKIQLNDGINFMKRSMSLGRLAFRPGKRRFQAISGAFAHDPLNRRYEFLFMDDPMDVRGIWPVVNGEGGRRIDAQQQHQQQKINHVQFSLVPDKVETFDGNDGLVQEQIPLVEYSMGKRSSLASGRIGFRPAKRSMAVGRTGFRPGKRSIATGRIRFRPGKRSMEQSQIEEVDELPYSYPF